jgi:hypothetical protein
MAGSGVALGDGGASVGGVETAGVEGEVVGLAVGAADGTAPELATGVDGAGLDEQAAMRTPMASIATRRGALVIGWANLSEGQAKGEMGNGSWPKSDAHAAGSAWTSVHCPPWTVVRS